MLGKNGRVPKGEWAHCAMVWGSYERIRPAALPGINLFVSPFLAAAAATRPR